MRVRLSARARRVFDASFVLFWVLGLPASGSGSNQAGPVLSFEGDAEDDDDALVQGEDRAVDMFAEAQKAVEQEEKAAAEEAEEAEGEDGGEPEDDFNAAWEVLDLARSLYEKRRDEDDEIKLKLADTYIALGDVSLETGAFTSQVFLIFSG